MNRAVARIAKSELDYAVQQRLARRRKRLTRRRLPVVACTSPYTQKIASFRRELRGERVVPGKGT